MPSAIPAGAQPAMINLAKFLPVQVTGERLPPFVRGTRRAHRRADRGELQAAEGK